MQNQKPSLKVHEWMAVTAILVVMLLLTLISIFNRKYGSSHYVFNKNSKNRIEVVVKGAVIHPGIYTLPHTQNLRTLLEVAETAPDADLRRFNMDRPVQQGRVVNVPKREMITVHVKAIGNQVQAVTVPRGTKVEELIGMISIPDNIDKGALNKKRRLKDGETITLKMTERTRPKQTQTQTQTQNNRILPINTPDTPDKHLYIAVKDI